MLSRCATSSVRPAERLPGKRHGSSVDEACASSCIRSLATLNLRSGAFLARSWRGFFLFLLVAILYGVTGLLTLAHPIAVAAGLTLMLAPALMVAGTFRIIVSLAERFRSWGWVLLNGILAVLLGIMIVMEWPASSLWVLGTFVGIDLIANGITWSVLAAEVQGALAPSDSR